ncbi:MAG: FAD-binding protein [Thiolinea sp.]
MSTTAHTTHLDQDLSESLQARVQQALTERTPLCIRGSGSKDWYGGLPQGEPLELSGHRGILNYEPTELVITARAGTPLTELEATLAAANQQLPFEPPHFGEQATLGGTLACNFSGPARPYAGAARDWILGCPPAQWQGRNPAVWRRGDEERGGLRCFAADGRSTGYARRAAGSVGQGAATPGK